jgi:hypothetical protein
MRKALLSFIVLLLVILLCGGKVFCQYDSSLYKQVVISKIEPTMKTGGPGYIFTLVSSDSETRYAYFRRLSRTDKDNWKNGQCLLLAISQWNDLLLNKK